MTRWRSRMGEERIVALLQGSLSIAVKTGAMKPTDTCQVTVDTTVQSKNVMVPTDAKLIHRAHGRLVRLAKRAGLDLRQTYVRVASAAATSTALPNHSSKVRTEGYGMPTVSPAVSALSSSPGALCRSLDVRSSAPVSSAASGISTLIVSPGSMALVSFAWICTVEPSADGRKIV